MDQLILQRPQRRGAVLRAVDEVLAKLVNELMAFVYLSNALMDATGLAGNGKGGGVCVAHLVLTAIEDLQIELREPIAVLD